MKRKIFVNDKHQSEFDENGFVKITLFSSEELRALKTIFNKHLAHFDSPNFISSNFLQHKADRKTIANEISSVISEAVNTVLTNIKLWHPAFLVKPIGENTEFKLHQDWTFVDEQQFYSGNLWLPLQDTNEKNGTLYVIPKSHFEFVNSIRAQTIHEIFWGNDSVLKPYCVPLNVKAGEVVFFQHSLIHYSSANISNHKRIAINCGFNSKNSSLKTYFRISETEAEEYEMDDNFVFEFDDAATLNNKPNGKFIQSIPIPYQHSIKVTTDLIKLFTQH